MNQTERDLIAVKRLISLVREAAVLAEKVGMEKDAHQLREFARRREPIVEQEEAAGPSGEVISMETRQRID